jgi:hypothetical protein
VAEIEDCAKSAVKTAKAKSNLAALIAESA